MITIDPDGFPYSVPLGYFHVGDEILMGVRSQVRKLGNIEANSKVSVLLESGSPMQDIQGVMLQGRATVHADPKETLRYARAAAKQRGLSESDLPSEPRQDAAYIRVVPQRSRSWKCST